MGSWSFRKRVAVKSGGIHVCHIGVFVIALTVVGCSCAVDDRSDETPLGMAENPSNDHNQLSSDTPIQEGYGIPSCYIGMPVAELSKDWERVPEPDLSDEMQFNKKKGMYIGEENGRVISVDFLFLDDELDPYQGSAREGISATSSLSEVRAKYGDPSYILESTRSDFGSFPNGDETVVDYVEKGIRFKFINDRLVSITVQSPDKHFDYERFKNAMGEDLVFIHDPTAGTK